MATVDSVLSVRHWSPLTTPLFQLQTPSATLAAAYNILDPLMKKLLLVWLRQALPSADSESGYGTIMASAQTQR